MYQVFNGCSIPQGPLLFKDVFLFGEEGIPLQGNRVINRFLNFADDQLLIWLLHHENRPLVALDGVVLPLFGDWSGNFWHWCMEMLPMALSAHEQGFTGTYLVPPAPFAADSLLLLGIRPEQIRRVEACDYHLQCLCLFPRQTGHDDAGTAARTRIRTVFRSLFANGKSSGHLYISRNGGAPETMRKVVDEERLLELLQRFGFTMLRLEELSLSEQLSYTCNAETLLGPHGAGMMHCAFMPERSLVIELFAPTYINPCILLPCRQLRHRYFPLTSACHYNGYPYGYDIDPHLTTLEMTLERELSDN
ncbi:glycosyltransferase family 61 protein [Geomonas azotofigens]|uniref:glycosyltransferase family 61 protein n=1 Tax=Geomonas azotofigens TaxID=2843196 RepID=UPI001C108248|nr:glycosyltransferase family 61 protein [Geomonas azotofigens]MBU5611472.1 glycosyltransferase family 61 protein [Geomonas azotofigens]